MGSISFGFAIENAEADRALQTLWEAGFLVRTGEAIGSCDPVTETAVWADRSYAGGQPSGELQQAHATVAGDLLRGNGFKFKEIGSAVSVGEPGREPLRAVGFVFVDEDKQRPQFTGSCFALRHTNHLLTAAHCVAGQAIGSLRIRFLGSAHRHQVVEVIAHPTADLALLRLAADTWPPGVDAFAMFTPITAWGIDFVGYGAVEDGGVPGLEPLPSVPTARVFKGHIQRLFADNCGRRFAELSVAAPPGFSGGPVFLPTAPYPVIAIVTGNWEGRTMLDRIVVTRDSSGVEREIQTERVTAFAVALLLGDLAEWLDEYIDDSPRDP